jgi:uncharacterized protein (TIGR02145 family)
LFYDKLNPIPARRKTIMTSAIKYLIPFFLMLALVSSCGTKAPTVLPEPTPKDDFPIIVEDAGTITDIDGNSYPALQIGEQVWMGSNMMATHGPTGEPVDYFCYNEEESNCQIYGRLYTLDAAMGGDSGEGAQGICPDGWHIPSMGEWETLIDELGGKNVAGKQLKEAGDEHWMNASSGPANLSQMTILPSGWFDFTLEYRGLGMGCFLRSSSAPNPSYASIWMLESNSAGIDRGDLHPDDAVPLRCTKD